MKSSRNLNESTAVSNIKIYIDRTVKFILQRKELRIVMAGLERAGKTTTLFQLKFGEAVLSVPTRRFNVESICCRKKTLTIWDVCSKDGEQFEQSFFINAHGIIIVVDSGDRERLYQAKMYMHNLLKLDKLTVCSVLVLCNKQDITNALSATELHDILEIKLLPQKKIRVQRCCALNGEGLNEGISWLAQNTV